MGRIPDQLDTLATGSVLGLQDPAFSRVIQGCLLEPVVILRHGKDPRHKPQALRQLPATVFLDFNPLPQVHQAAVQATLDGQRIVARNVIDLPLRPHLTEILGVRHPRVPAGVPLLRALCFLPAGLIKGPLKEPVLLVRPVATHPVVLSHLGALSVPVGHCPDIGRSTDLLVFLGYRHMRFATVTAGSKFFPVVQGSLSMGLDEPVQSALGREVAGS